MQESAMRDQTPSYPQKGMTTKSWLGTLLLLMIPIANIVLLFVWAFGGDESPRKYYSRASLILVGAVFVIYILIFILFMALGTSMSNTTY